MRADPPSPKLPRAVVLLGWVSFFNDVASEMVYPLLPIFMVGVLGASATSVGWVEGVAQAVVAVLAAWVGWRSDRFRRRVPYVRLGYGLPVLGKAVLVTAVAWPLVLLGRVIDRVGKGVRGSPRDALIADATDPAIRGRAFGLLAAMDSAGAVIGVVASALLLRALGDETDAAPFRVIFAVAAVLGLAALACTLVLREPAHADAPAPTAAAPARRSLSPAYWRTLAVLIVFSLANSSDTFLLLHAEHAGLHAWQVVLAYAVYSFVYMAASYPIGVLSDRLGRWGMILTGWTIYAGVYAGIAATGATAIWPLLAVYGLYIALTDGVGKALIADRAPKAHRGFAIGVFQMANGGAMLAASVIAGALWDRVGEAAPFWMGAITAGVALALALVLRPWRATEAG